MRPEPLSTLFQPIDVGDLMGRRVLITGGLGFIGSNLAHTCVALGAHVTVFDSLEPGSGGNRANVAEIAAEIRIVLGDIRNAEGVWEAVSRQDIVFHCAAYTSHPDSMKDPFVDVDVNCKGTLNVLEALRRFNAHAKLVHIGTSTQTGPMVRALIDEEHPEFPVDIYSANKLAAEKYVLIYGRAYGLHVTVVRLSNTYGPRSNIRNPDLGFMNYFMGLGFQNKDITVFGEGAQLRTVVYVQDAVNALLRAAISTRSEGQVYFASGDEQFTVAEIAEAVASGVGGKVKHVEWPEHRKVLEVGDAVIGSARIRDELGADFSTSLAEGIALTRAYFKSRLRDYL